MYYGSVKIWRQLPSICRCFHLQAAIMNPRMSCWQREYLLSPDDDQILRLTPSFSWSGCHVVVSADDRVGELFVCQGGRSFSVDTADGHVVTWHVALSKCSTMNGLELRYRLEVRNNFDCFWPHFAREMRALLSSFHPPSGLSVSRVRRVICH